MMRFMKRFRKRLAEGPRMSRVQAVLESNATVDKTYRAFVIE